MKNRLKFVITILVATMTTLTGCGVGNMLFQRAQAGTAVNPENPELQNRYETRPNGKSPVDFNDPENINYNLYIAAGVLKETNYWSTVATGKVTARVGPIPYNQQVYSRRVVNNDSNKEWFFQTNTISAFVKKSEQRFVNPTSFLTRTGSNPTMDGATYSKDNIIGFTENEYIDRYGNFSNNLSNYVLNDYSITSGELVSTDEEAGLYTYHYTLDPIYSAAKYMREVQFMSGSTSYPSFSKTEMNITIDKEWRVHKVNSIDVYRVSIMGGLTCSSDIDDVFTYSDSYQEIPEKEDFKDMFGTAGGGTTITKSAMDYLTEAAAPFMAPGEVPINVEAKLNINNTIIPIYANIDLKNLVFKISIDDQVFIYYENEKVYLLCGEDLNFVVEQDELLNLVKHYIPDFAVGDVNIADLLEAPFFSTMMETMTLETTSEKAIVSMSGEGMDVDINLNLDSTSTASFESIDVTYNKDPLNLKGNIVLFTEEHEYKDIPSTINEITNLNGLANSIDKFIEAKSVSGLIDFTFDGSTYLKGEYLVDYNDTDHILGQVDLTLYINNEEIDFSLLIDNEDLYLIIEDKVAKMTVTEAGDLVFDIATNLLTDKTDVDSVLDLFNGEFDFNSIKNDIIPLLNNLIEAIETNDEGVKVSLDLTSYKLAEGIDLEYTYNDSLFNISIADIGNITLVPGTKLSLDLPQETNITSKQIQQLTRMVLDYEEVRKASFSLTYDKDEIEFEVNGLIDLLDLIAQGTINFNLDGVKGSGTFTYQNNEIVLNLSEKIKARLTNEQLVQLAERLKELLAERNIIIPSFSAPKINSVSISSIISSITFDGNKVTLPFDLSTLGIQGMSGTINATIEPLKNSISINYEGLSLNISLTRYPEFNEVITADDYLSYDEFDTMLEGLFGIYDGYDNLSFNFNASIKDTSYLGEGFITIDEDNNYYTVSLIVNDSYTINLIYSEGKAYLDINGIKIKGSPSTVIAVSEQVLNAFNVNIPLLNDLLTSLETGVFDYKLLLGGILELLPKDNDIDLADLISSFTYDEDVLQVVLNIENENITFNWDISEKSFAVSTTDINASLSYQDSNTSLVINPSDEYLDLDPLQDLRASTILNFADFINNDSYKIDASLVLPYDDTNITLKIKDSYLNIDGGVISAQLNITIEIYENEYDATIYYLNDKVYLSALDKIFVSDDLNQILSLLSSESTSIKNIDIKNILTQVCTSFNDIVKSISVDNEGKEVIVNLDLSSLSTELITLSSASVSYNEQSNSVVINLANLGDLSISSLLNKEEITAPMGEYLSIADINKYIDSAKSLIENKKFEITVDIKTSVASKQIEISGTLIADLKDKFDISFDGSIYFDGISSTIKLVKSGDSYYIDLGNVKVNLTFEEIYNLITRINVEYSLGLDSEVLTKVQDILALLEQGQYQDLINLFYTKPSTNEKVAVSSILDIINGVLEKLTVTKENINLSQYDLSNYVNVLGTSSLTISNAFDITFVSNLGTVTLAPTTKDIIIPTSAGYLCFEEIEKVLDLVKEVKNGNKVAYDYDFSKKDIKITGNIQIEFDGFNSVISITGTYDIYNFELTYINNVIYVEVNGAKIQIGFGEAITLIDNVLNSLNKNTEKISNILSSLSKKELPVLSTETPKINIDTLISKFSYVENILSIGINNEINLDITLDTEISSIDVTYQDYSISISRSKTRIATALTDALDLNSLANVNSDSIKEIIDELSTGIFDITLSEIKVSATKLSGLIGKEIPAIVDQVTVSGTVYVDIKSSSLQADLAVSYDDKLYSIVLTYIDDVITLDIFDTIYIKDTKENVIGFIKGYANVSSTTSIKTNSLILDFLKNFNSLVTGISGNELGIEISFNTESFGYADSGKIKVNTAGINILSNASGEISLVATNKKEITTSNNEYITVEEIDKNIDSIVSLSESKNYVFTFDLTLPQSYGGYDVSGDVKADIDNKFDFEVSNLTISSPDFNVSLTLTKVGENFYFDLGTVQFVLSIDDLVKVITRLEVEFALDFGDIDLDAFASAIKTMSSGDINSGLNEILNMFAPATTRSNTSFDINKIFDLINIFDVVSGIKFNNVEDVKYISLDTDLSSVNYMIGDISAKYYADTKSLSLVTNSVIKSINLKAGESISIVAPSIDSAWNDVDDINSIVDKIGDVVSFLQKKQFSLSADGVIRTNGVLKYSYSGNVKLDLSDSQNIKVDFSAVVNQLDIDGNITRTHIVAMVMDDSTIYLTYNNKLKVYLTMRELLQLVRYITDVMNIQSDLLSSLLDGVTEGIGTGVFQPVVPEMKPLDLNINKFLKSLAVNENEDGSLGDLLVELDAEQMYVNLSGFNPNSDEEKSNSIIKAAISTSSGMMNSIKVENIYSQSGEIFDINVSFDDIYSTETDLGIAAPSTLDGYYDFNTITALVKTFFNSADIASYKIEGNLQLKLTIPVLTWFTSYQTLPLTIEIELDENSVPTVHAQLYSSSDVSVTIVKIFSRGTADIYYDGHTQTIYVKRYYGNKPFIGSVRWYTVYGTYSIADLADPNKIGEMITLILQSDSIVSNAIKDNMTGSSMEAQNPILFEDVLTAYTSSYEDSVYKYNMTISGSSLIKDDQLSDIDLEFSTMNSKYEQEEGTAVEKDYLSYLYVATELMGMIGLRVSGNLTNVFSDAAPQHISVSIPSGAINGETNW